MNNSIYDLIVIGGGISSCTLISSILKKGYKGKIAIVEYGRSLGGRCSSRISKKNKGWILNHGSPHFNINNNSKNPNLNNFIEELLENNFIKKDDSLLIQLDENLNYSKNISSEFSKGNIYSSTSSMSNLASMILNLNNKNNQIDFYFQKLIINLFFDNNNWVLKSNEGNIFHSKFLIISSNLLLHERSKRILNVDEIPLAKAIKNNINIDEIITKLNSQDYIRRINYLIYPKTEYQLKKTINNDYLIYFLDKKAELRYEFERIIFQRQKNGRYGIILHSIINNNLIKGFEKDNSDKLNHQLLDKFNAVFDHNPLINKLSDYEDISIMKWRASQPTGMGVPVKLQICDEYKIAFCGDWFDNEGFGRVEGAILSALKLSDQVIDFI